MVEARDKKYLEIITYLNKMRLVGLNEIFDCGKLGFVHIYRSQQHWYGDWFEPDTRFKE